MLINSETKKMTSGKYIPRLTTLCVELVGENQLELCFDYEHAKNTVENKFLLTPSYSHMHRNIDVFGKPVNVFDCGDEASEWVSNWLHQTRPDQGDDPTKEKDKKDNYRIVFFDPNNECEREVSNDFISTCEKLGTYKPDQISYAATLGDCGAYTIHSVQSEKYVSDEIEKSGGKKLNENCFRSNIVVDCFDKSKPFQEDGWDEVYFGNEESHSQLGESFVPYKLKFYGPVPRCPQTTFNSNNGHARPDGQPLKWLSKNRVMTENDSEAFGMAGRAYRFANHFGVMLDNLCDTGEVSVGDVVYVREF